MRVPYAVIEQATQGDLDAVHYVIRHYNSFICAQTRNTYVREEMKEELIQAILRFKIRIR